MIRVALELNSRLLPGHDATVGMASGYATKEVAGLTVECNFTFCSCTLFLMVKTVFCLIKIILVMLQQWKS